MTTNQSNNLRPCPFCGSEAVTRTIYDWDDLEYMFIEVNDCDLEVTCENERCINGWYLSPKEWNTRPIEDALTARIAELEAAQRWIPVSERLPDTKFLYDKFDVIVELGDIGDGEMIRRVALLFYDYRNKSWNDDCGEFGFYPVTGVTHWRERPKPPEVQE